jgi:hypothetical protein
MAVLAFLLRFGVLMCLTPLNVGRSPNTLALTLGAIVCAYSAGAIDGRKSLATKFRK